MKLPIVKEIFLIFFFPLLIHSQNYKVGFSGNILVKDITKGYQLGPTLIFDATLNRLPFSIQGKTRFYLSEISTENFSSAYTYTSLSLGTQINFFPVKWDIEPYIGVGLFYNFNNIQSGGNPSPRDTDYRFITNIKNNFSLEILGGILFSANTPIIFFIELSKEFNSPADIVIINSTKMYEKRFEDLYFQSLFFKVGLLFTI